MNRLSPISSALLIRATLLALITFVIQPDTALDYAMEINRLMHEPVVARDLKKVAEPDGDGVAVQQDAGEIIMHPNRDAVRIE